MCGQKKINLEIILNLKMYQQLKSWSQNCFRQWQQIDSKWNSKKLVIREIPESKQYQIPHMSVWTKIEIVQVSSGNDTKTKHIRQKKREERFKKVQNQINRSRNESKPIAEDVEQPIAPTTRKSSKGPTLPEKTRIFCEMWNWTWNPVYSRQKGINC